VPEVFCPVLKSECHTDSNRLSKKLSRLAVDSELWKALFYRAFVLPRASRIPGIKDIGSANRLHYSSRLSKWLDDEYLVKDGVVTNFKEQYRLRHNWLQGQCTVSEVVVADRAPDPPLLAMMSNGIVYAADSISGLRAWSSKDKRDLLATNSLVAHEGATLRLPVSMTVDSSDADGASERVAMGFADGSFSIYALNQEEGRFETLFTHPPSTNGAITAIAYSSGKLPYLVLVHRLC
jgi:hypothetical protein